METNLSRIRITIEQLAQYNDTPGRGITRFSYSEQDNAARLYLSDICKDIGLAVRTDAVGNMFARLVGSDSSLPPIMVGSHFDSVKHGGKFDGVAGVVSAIEVVRTLVENNFEPTCSIDVAFFAEEEGSNFNMPAFGSKALVGALSEENLLSIRNNDGISAFEVIKKAGFKPENIAKDALQKGEYRAMIEVHIEQSIRLESSGNSVGIVNGIAGLNWFEVVFEGQPNHAGATPMHLRKDSMAAAGAVIAKVGGMARSVSSTTVATVGKIESFPNIPNIIPGRVSFVVDIRDTLQENIDNVAMQLKSSVIEAAEDCNVSYSIEKIASNHCVAVPQYLVDIMVNSACKLRLDYELMPSGAVHDASNIADICDVGMIFLPSIGGRSHVPEENTEYTDIKVGADLLLAVLLKLAI